MPKIFEPLTPEDIKGGVYEKWTYYPSKTKRNKQYDFSLKRKTYFLICNEIELIQKKYNVSKNEYLLRIIDNFINKNNRKATLILLKSNKINLSSLVKQFNIF